MQAEAKEIRPELEVEAESKSFGGDTHSVDQTADRPTWDTLVLATLDAQVVGYELGYAAGLRDAADERDAEVLRQRAAEVIRNVVSDRSRTWAPAGQPQRKGRAA